MISTILTTTQSYLTRTTASAPPGPAGPVLDDLVLYYDANDTDCYPGSGTAVTDLSDGGNDGTMNNSLPVNTVDGALAWDWGDSQNTRNITVPHSSDFNMSTAISMEVWFWIPDLNRAKNGEQHYFAKRRNASSHGSTGYQWYMRNRPDAGVGPMMMVNVANESTGYDQYYPAGYNATNWWHQVTTWNTTDKKWRYYLNGSLVNTSAAKSSAAFNNGTSGVLYLGAHIPGNVGQPKGGISIFRLYKDRQLSDAEVLQNYNADKDTFGL